MTMKTMDFTVPIRKADPGRAVTAAELQVAIDNLLELRKRDYAEIMALYRLVGRLESGLKDVMTIFEPILVEYERTHGMKRD
jgi:hypothetical protein